MIMIGENGVMDEKRLNESLHYQSERKIKRVFEEIYREYYRFVYFQIKQYVSKKEEIEELTDDVFIRFYRLLDRNREVQNIKGYLFAAAKNRAIDYLRKNEKNNASFDDNSEYVSEAKQEDIFDFMKACLTEKEYAIIIRHLIEKDSLRFIASQTHQSPNTVKSIYRRSIKKVQKEWVKRHEKN